MAGNGRNQRRLRSSKDDSAPGGLREDILAAGAEFFGTKGYAATTTREIAEAVGTTSGGLYYYFETKEQLLFGICQQALAGITFAVSTELAPLQDPVERIEAFIRSHIMAMLSDLNLHKTMLIELRSLSGSRYSTIVEGRREYLAIARDLIIDAQRSRAISPDLNPRGVALVLLNMMNWTIFWYHRDGPISSAELAEMVTGTFLHGTLGEKWASENLLRNAQKFRRA